MVLNLDQVEHFFELDKLTYYSLRDNSNHLISFFGGDKEETKTSLDAISNLKSVLRKVPTGRYYIEAKRMAVHPLKFHYMFDYVNVELDAQVKESVHSVQNQMQSSFVSAPGPVFDKEAEFAKMKLEIRKEIELSSRMESIRLREQELNSELKLLSTFQGKIQRVLEPILENIVQNGLQKFAPQMQGFKQENSEDMGMFDSNLELLEPKKIEDLTQEDHENIQKSINIFVKMMHPNYISQIANEIDDNPKLVSKILNKLLCLSRNLS